MHKALKALSTLLCSALLSTALSFSTTAVAIPNSSSSCATAGGEWIVPSSISSSSPCTKLTSSTCSTNGGTWVSPLSACTGLSAATCISAGGVWGSPPYCKVTITNSGSTGVLDSGTNVASYSTSTQKITYTGIFGAIINIDNSGKVTSSCTSPYHLSTVITASNSVVGKCCNGQGVNVKCSGTRCACSNS